MHRYSLKPSLTDFKQVTPILAKAEKEIATFLRPDRKIDKKAFCENRLLFPICLIYCLAKETSL